MDESSCDLKLWVPTLVELPPEWASFVDKLSSYVEGFSQATRIYILDVRYNAKCVADQLKQWGMSQSVIIAAYLWEYSEEQICSADLPDLDIVLGHIRESRLYAHYIEEENLPPLLTPPYKDVGALLLTTAIYFQALKILQEQSNGHPYRGKLQSSIESTASVLLNIYKFLGIWQQKRAIEDLSAQLREPSRYRELEQDLAYLLSIDSLIVNQICQLLTASYREATQRPIMVFPSPCGIMGMRRRVQNAAGTQQQTNLTAFDLITFNVLVPTVRDCYTALGVLSQLGDVQERIIERITTPKHNGSSYIVLKLSLNAQSLDIAGQHSVKRTYTCLLQITTDLMHAITQYGCLYPRCYSLYGETQDLKEEKLEPVAVWHSKEGNVFSAIKKFLSERSILPDARNPIIVFDKDRQPIPLPKGSTALDFAYLLDSKIGEYAVDALINDRKSPLYRQIEAGDVVEIRTASEIQAQEYWLSQNYSRIGKVRKQIKESLSRRFMSRSGYNQLREILERHHYILNPEALNEELQQLVKQYRLGKLPDYMEKLDNGKGELDTPQWAALRIMERIAERNELSPLSGKLNWIPVVKKQLQLPHTMFYQQRTCRFCKPQYPQDIQILGRVRKYTGELIVHKESCPHLNDNYSDLLPMSWQPQPPPFSVAFFMLVQNRRGLVLDLTKQLRKHRCELSFLKAETIKYGQAHILFTIEISTDSEALTIWQAVEKINGVMRVAINEATTAPHIHHRLRMQHKMTHLNRLTATLEPVWTESMVVQPPRATILHNPFNISQPATKKMFFGRTREMAEIQAALCDGELGEARVLYGPLRSGKSSICTNFIDYQLHYPSWGVLYSLQDALWQDEESIFRQLADKISVNFHAQFQYAAPNWQDCAANDSHTSFRSFIQLCIAQTPAKRLVLALDEFGGAVEAYQTGILKLRFFSYWKELIKDIPQLSLLFALPTGAHATLFSREFANVFSFAPSLKVSYLDDTAAQKLLIEPLHEQHIEVHPTTVAHALRLTGRNPYYMTLLGHQLVEYLNKDSNIQLVTDTEFYPVVDSITKGDFAYNFNFLKKELQNEEELLILEVLVKLTSEMKQSHIQCKKIADRLDIAVSRVRKHLDRLRLGLILNQIGPLSNPYYSFKIELVRRWLAHNSWFFDALG